MRCAASLLATVRPPPSYTQILKLTSAVWYYFNDIFPPLHNGRSPLDPPAWWIRLFDGAPADQVGQRHVVFLTNPVQPAQSLLDLHRVPGQVEVHHHVAELEVTTLTRRLCGEQDRRVGGGVCAGHAGETADRKKVSGRRPR